MATASKGKRKALPKQPPATSAKKASAREPARKPSVKAARAGRGNSSPPVTRRGGAQRRGGVESAAELRHQIEQFLYHQAELLDAKRWQDYIDLFADDGVYWMPASPQDSTWDGVPAIFAEDKNLMTVRMKRVLHPDAWSQRPLWGTNHVVGNVILQAADGAPDELVVRSRFHMMELRRDNVRHFAGAYTHHLRRTPDGLRIKLQRVDMTNAQAAYDYVLQVWV
jgi:3-phenylpropionate/cinnamic acid dioxygenase small subunit